MTADAFRIAELLLSGFKCSHVLMMLALEEQGRQNPDLIRAMSGLALGMGQGKTCGALSGACCVIGLCAGKDDDDAPEDPRFAGALEDFTAWFHAVMTERHGGTDCADIIHFDEARKAEICPTLILDVWTRLLETLDDHGIDIAAVRDSRN
jgi:C_GCAxxG_C_C family probable redox protein